MVGFTKEIFARNFDPYWVSTSFPFFRLRNLQKHGNGLRILSKLKQFSFSGAQLASLFVLPPGFEPGITASKAVVISISLRERTLY